jgi:chlorobactene glucosyltransferase
VILTLLLAFVALALFIIGLTTLSNVMLFPRLGRPVRPLPPNLPRISFLIPARDEAATIHDTITALLRQDYPDFEVVLLDDGSTDDTFSLASTAGRGDRRLKILTGRPLPAGWLGKNWACQQLGAAATGEILIFTDADVCWEPGAGAVLVGEMAHHKADLLSIWPTQVTVTWAERLIVPQIALAIIGYLPVLSVHTFPWAIFAAANGQCMAFNRSTYGVISGHTAVATEVVEDVMLARRVKSLGYRLRMADGAGLIRCRMYDGWSEVRDGFAKNILAGHGGSVLFLLASTMFHWIVFVLPWFLWIWDWRFAVLAVIGILIRGATASFTRQRVGDAVLMPVSVALMTIIAARSMVWHFRGGPHWKGRVAKV